MKRTMIILSAVMLPGLSVPVSAESSPRVYGTVAEDDSGNDRYIQLAIENNTGLMGYKLLFEYDPNTMEIISAERGEALGGGMFLGSGGEESGEFQLLWNSTENSSDNGVFAILEIEQKNDTPYEIKMSFSQEDTFNEAWEDVSLICENISSEEKNADAPGIKEIEASLEERLPERLEQAIFELDTERSPGEMIEDYLVETGETALTEGNIREVNKLFEAEGLDRELGEKLSSSELLEIYGKAYGDYTATVKEVKTPERGNNPTIWLLGAIPIAAVVGIIVIIYRRMKNIEKRK